MDRPQFLQEFLRHRQILFSFILSIVRNRESAEDIFQDVALIAFDKCATFETGTDFGAWVREIARRRIMKARETAAVRKVVALEPEAIDAIAAAHERAGPEAWQDREKALENCLGKLPERQQQIVRWRYRDLLGFDLIAKKLQSTVNSVQVTLTKVRKALRRCAEATLAPHG
jgi:RNA polymerase sigma-70 factor (ECF subfamily)